MSKETSKQISTRFRQLFASSNGKKVLADLEKQCGFNTCVNVVGDINPNKVMFNEGKRSIYCYIKRKIKNE